MEDKPTSDEPSDVKDLQVDESNTKQCDEQTYPSRLGYFNYRPDYLQMFNTPRWLLAVLCFYVVIVNVELLGFRGVVVPQIEKRFNMTSTLIGSIMSTVDISSGICGVILTYYVGQRHKSKWIGYGLICLGIGSIVFILPHFIAGPYYYRDLATNNTQANPLCRLNSSTALPISCTNAAKESSPWIHPLVFVLGLVLCGIGYSIQYNVGLAYIDESISPTISPVYVSVFHMIATIGPTLGYVVGGVLSSIYVDWPATPTGLKPNDPRWIGAWWLGYLIIGCITIASSVFIFAFPYHLPTYQKSKMKRLAQCKSVNKVVVDNQYGKRWIDFPRALYEIVSNRIFLLAVVGLSIDQIPAIGLVTFLPKIIQSQSGASLLTATTLTGVTVVISGALGQVGSGIIIKRWNLVGSKISRFCFYACIINLLAAGPFLLSCDNPKIAGVYVPYPPSSNVTLGSQTTLSIQPSATCNAMCHCDNSAFNPVCGANGISYQSPCHAGCNSLITTGSSAALNYSRCNCINSATEKLASNGLCSTEICPMMYPLLIGIMFMVVCTYVTFSPTVIVILRSIPDSQTTFGMGVEGLIYRIVGGLLGPVVYGYVMDASCILWNEQCGQRQFCWRYDNGRLALYVFTATAICKGVKLVIYGLLWYYHRKQELTAVELTPEQNDKPASTADVDTDEKGGEIRESNGESKVKTSGKNHNLETQI